MCHWRSLAACGLLSLGAANIVYAQTTRGYAGAAFTLGPWSVHAVSGGSPSTTYSNKSADTRVTGVTAEGAWYFARRAALGLEVSLPGQRNEIHQEFRYFSPALRFSRYQEALALVVVRGDHRLTDRVGLGLVGGGGFVYGTSHERHAHGQFGSPDYGLFGPETQVSRTSLGLTLGTDLMVTLVRHVSLVPRFRLLFVDHGGPSDDSEPFFATLGLPRVVWTFGIGIRAPF